MNAALLMLLAIPTVDVSVVTPKQAHTELAQQVQTGSLLVSRGDCLAVKAYSASRFTHVATVVIQENGIYCYDATGGIGVRKLTLTEYLETQKDAAVHPFHPCRPLSATQQKRLASHLESELGRPYSISHHLTGNRCAGLHCSEYATDGLIACGLLVAKEPSRVSPASLVEGIRKAQLYSEADSLQLAPEPPPKPQATSWCGQFWLDTKYCTVQCYRQLRGWFCCK